jgi:hypothetical protein
MFEILNYEFLVQEAVDMRKRTPLRTTGGLKHTINFTAAELERHSLCSPILTTLSSL